MFNWIANNIGTILVCALLIVIIALAVVSIVKDKKKGKSSCGCNCNCCPMGNSCHNKKK